MQTVTYEILTPDLFDEIEGSDVDDQWIFLDESEEFRGCWEVDGLTSAFFSDFESIIGPHCLLTPLGLDEFLSRARALEYRVVFMMDPVHILTAYEHLKAEPAVKLQSSMENTVNGFLPWQVIGYNKLIKDESLRAGYVVWATGAGKSAFMAAAVQHHLEVGHKFDLAMIVVKAHNKIEQQRKLLRMTGIDAVVYDGDWWVKRQRNGEKVTTPGSRQVIYEDLTARLNAGERVVVVTNYEKFRDDKDQMQSLVEGRDCLFFWDEMPTKLSNRDSQLYKSVKSVLYRRVQDKSKLPAKRFKQVERTSWVRHWALTATPVENSPADVFSCVDLMWPRLLGTWTEFDSTYVLAHQPFSGKPAHWHNLDLLEAKLAFMTHRVSKEDPAVAEMFAQVIPSDVYIDWKPQHRTLYDKLTGKAADIVKEVADANVLALMQVMQMICDAPSMVIQSNQNREAFSAHLSRLEENPDLDLRFSGPTGSEVAQMLLSVVPESHFTDKGHTKLERWREIIVDKHPDSKILTYSAWGSYIFPVWERWLTEWGVPFVIFDGTTRQKQAALDRFRSDPDIRVFCSGDAGSDSIDIPQANVVVNYNFPWKWTTDQQRVGRADRVDSTFDLIYKYSLIMPNSVDERRKAICERKRGYHEAIFDGRAIDEAFSATMSREDLIYLLLGDR